MPNQKEKQKQEPQQAQSQASQQPIQAVPTPRLEPEKALFTWKAPARSFKKREREFWVKLIAIASIFAFILYIVEGAMPVILLIALVYLFFILSSVEPEVIEYKITNRGIDIAQTKNDWQLINRFWFSKRMGSDLLVLETFYLTGKLELIINEKDKDKIKTILGQYIPEEEVVPSGMEKASSWLSKRLS